MSESGYAQYKTLLLALAAIAAIWGVLGIFDMRNIPDNGYLTDGNNTITKIYAGSPAEAAGLQVGDYIRSVGGISVEDSKALARRGRAMIGETREIVVERGAATELGAGEVAMTESVELTYAGLSGRNRGIGWVATIIGFAFLLFGIYAYLQRASLPTTLLAATGICLGIAFFGGPYFESYGLRTATGSIQLVLIVFGFAFLLHFMLSFPKAKAVLSKPWAKYAVYGPAALIALMFLWLIILQPAGTSRLNQTVNVLVGLFIVYYFGWAVIAMLQSYAAATPEEKSRYGLNLMMVGVLVGLLPVTIASVVGIFSPQTVLPGSDFYFFTMILIPVALAAAAMKPASAPMAEAA